MRSILTTRKCDRCGLKTKHEDWYRGDRPPASIPEEPFKTECIRCGYQRELKSTRSLRDRVRAVRQDEEWHRRIQRMARETEEMEA